MDLNTEAISYRCVAYIRESKCVKFISGNQVMQMQILRDMCATSILESFLPYSHYFVVPSKSKHGFTFLCVY